MHKPQDIDEFKRRINQNIDALKQDGESKHYLDMKDEWLTIESFTELSKYGPFGQGFKIPSFKFSQFTIVSNRIIRGGISFDLAFANTNISAVYFLSTIDQRLIESNFTSLIGRVSVDNYRNQAKLKILIESYE